LIQLTILHTNDLHGHVKQLLRIASLIRRIRTEVEANGGYCLYLDAGDSEDTSNLESSLTKGSAMEAILRGAGCDYVALGNAIPLRYGPEAVENLAVHFGKPLLCGNIFNLQGELIDGLEAYAVQTFGSLKVGLIGLTDPMDVYRAVFKLDAKKPGDVLPSLIEKVRSQEAKFIILLSHLSSPVDQQLTEKIPGMDIIIGGHDHKKLCPPLDINGTVIVQAGEYGQFLGRLDLEIDDETGKIVSYKGELISVEEKLPNDPQTQRSVENEQKRIQEIMNRQIGILENAFEYSEDSECAAGNLLADALLDRMEGAQVALTLAGHWTTGLKAGVVTQGELFSANRSTANPARVELSGKQILTFIHEALKPENAARRLHALRGGAVGMPHVAGMRVCYDPEDENNLEIKIGNEPLIEDKKYIVASTDMEISEFIDYLIIPDEQIEYEVPTIMPEVVEDYIRQNSPLQLPQKNRLSINDQKQQNAVTEVFSINKKLSIASELFGLLEGTWQGEGRGGYLTIDSFDYREKLVFTRRDESTSAYEQRTEKRMDGTKEFVTSHWESGFISILENGDLELVNAQSGGQGEALIGHIQTLDPITRIHFVSKALMNDARMVSTTRVFELEGDQLRYEMEMSTTKVNDLTWHLAITLERVRE
jgi:5'-nucleotidase